MIVAAVFVTLATLLRLTTQKFFIEGARKDLRRRFEMNSRQPMGFMRQPPGRDPNGPGQPPNGPGRPGGQNDPYRPLWLNPSGKSVQPSDQRTSFDQVAFQRSLQGTVVESELRGEHHLLVISGPAPAPPQDFADTLEPNEIPAVLQIAIPIDVGDQATAALDRSLLVLLPVALLIAGLVSWNITGRALKPVADIRKSADNIAGTNLGERLPVTSEDEFSQLAASFNALLERVQTSATERDRLIERLKRFTADASHELKTPLTVIKGTASFARDRELTPEEAKSSFSTIDQAANTMQRLVQDLLLLASADEQRLGRDKVTLPYADVVDQALAMIGAYTSQQQQEQQIIKSVEPEFGTWTGNEGELVRLVRNLLENATRYRLPGTEVQLFATPTQLIIRNQCDPISQDKMKHLGERFFRIDSARTRKDGGSGLGLAICTELANANGAKLALTCSDEGQFEASVHFTG